MSTSQSLVRTTLRTITLALLILISVIFVFGAVFGVGKTKQIQLNEGDVSYDVQKNSGKVEHYTEPHFKPIKEGETLTVTINPIGSGRAMEHVALVFSMYHCYVKVYLDDELIYEQTEPGNDRMIGHRYYRIALSPGYETKTIRIEAVVSENDSFSTIANMRFVQDVDALYSFQEGNTLYFIQMLTMLIAALFLQILALIRSVQRRKLSEIFHIAAFTVSSLIWCMGFQDLYVPFINNAEFVANAEYVGLFFAPLPLALFVRAISERGIFRHIGTAFSVFFAADFALATIADLVVPGVHYCDFINQHRIAFLIMLIYAIIALFHKRPRMNTTAGRVYYTGFIIVASLTFLELLRFYLNEEFGSTVPFLRIRLTPLALTALFITLVFYYGSIYSEDSYLKIEQANLKKLVYIDPMTDAPNRTSCARKMEEMSSKGRKDFVFVFVDINFLKATNDTYGHDKGDELICTTGDLLKKYFSENGFYGRWGGDEFIACHYGSEEETLELMNSIQKDIDDINRRGDLGFDMSVSWGCGVSTKENPLTPEEAVHKADEQMYLDKQKMHTAREE